MEGRAKMPVGELVFLPHSALLLFPAVTPAPCQAQGGTGQGVGAVQSCGWSVIQKYKQGAPLQQGGDT